MVATKVRMPMGEGPNDGGLSRRHIIAQCEASLRRLRADHIDLYQVHEWDGQTPLEETLEALDTLVRSGKVRYVGCSNYAGWHLMKALAASERHGYQRFVSQQIHYTLQAREAEYELVPIALNEQVGILSWSPLAGGLLSGKYRRGVRPESGRQLTDWDEPPVRDEDALYDIVDALVEIGEGHGVVGRTGCGRLVARPARRDLARDRRPHRRTARGQPRRGGTRALGRRTRAARRAERAPADLSLLAPREVGRGPPRARRPVPSGAVPGRRGVSGRPGKDERRAMSCCSGREASWGGMARGLIPGSTAGLKLLSGAGQDRWSTAGSLLAASSVGAAFVGVASR